MKVNIVARPDHSLLLYEQLRAVKDKTDVIDLYTFYALREGSIPNRLFPGLKVAPESSKTLDSYTVASRVSNLILKKLGINHRENEKRLFNLLSPNKKLRDCDVLHYWPFYSVDVVRKLKEKYSLKTVAEYYEAEPSFVSKIFESEYVKFGLEGQKNSAFLIKQNECFDFESNIIVASEYTKSTYKQNFKHVNYHVCSYGPCGYSLQKKPVFTRKTQPIVFVGQICLEKGIHYLIEAVKQTGLELHLIGPIRSGQEHIFKPLIASNKLVTYKGKMRHTEVLASLKNYSIFCMPSLSDNYSLAVVEALSWGMPVLVTENCGNAEDIEEFYLGQVVKIKSSTAIADALENLISRSKERDFSNGIDDFFSMEKRLQYPKAVLNVYQKLIS